jgi:hypothetical protein
VPGERARRSWTAGIRVAQAATTKPVAKNTTVVAARARRSSTEVMPSRYPATAITIHEHLASSF